MEKKLCTLCPPSIYEHQKLPIANHAVKYPDTYADASYFNNCDSCIYRAISIAKEIDSSDQLTLTAAKTIFADNEKLCKQLLAAYDWYHLKQFDCYHNKLTEFEKCYIMLRFIDANRLLFCREEERIICTESFRRLQYKTQVMVNSVSDDQRTRLLHSLEVQKISRKIAVALRANRELTETIAIAHDIGHAPFGHAGESALNAFLSEHFAGKFSHAVQGVKVVDFLCSHRTLKPLGLKGLAISNYVLEGILKHDSDTFTDNAAAASYRLQYNCSECYNAVGYNSGSSQATETVMISGIETQIVHWADKIAYMGHDWEEFVGIGLLETMLFRVNTVVIKMKEYSTQCDDPNMLSSISNAHTKEIELMKDILALINEIRTIYVNLCEKGKKVTDFYEIEIRINSICEKIEIGVFEKSNSAYVHNKLLSEEQYTLFMNFLRAVCAWAGLTGRYPQNTGEKMDVIFIFYNRDTML